MRTFLATEGSEIERGRSFPVVTAAISLGALGVAPGAFYGNVSRLVDQVFSEYAAKLGKRRWAEKEVWTADKLDLLDQLFVFHARFIHIARHGLDVAWSEDELSSHFPWHSRTSVSLFGWVEKWVEKAELTADFCERSADRCLRVRYEDLISDPEPTARRLFEFLGEPWSPTIFEDMRRAAPRRLGDFKAHEAHGRIDPTRRDRWKTWPGPIVAQLGRIVNPTLVRLGYEPLAV